MGVLLSSRKWNQISPMLSAGHKPGDIPSVDACGKALAPSLQLALNLLELRYVGCSEEAISDKDYKQHVDERVSRKVD
jgi:hypothetical protein